MVGRTHMTYDQKNTETYNITYNYTCILRDLSREILNKLESGKNRNSGIIYKYNIVL